MMGAEEGGCRRCKALPNETPEGRNGHNHSCPGSWDFICGAECEMKCDRGWFHYNLYI